MQGEGLVAEECSWTKAKKMNIARSKQGDWYRIRVSRREGWYVERNLVYLC